MGTGLNSQIIATSTYWRFEFFTGIILLSLALPLNYILTKNMGVIGPAVSNLIAFTIYNSIRCAFLWKKVKMQPFTMKSLLTVLLGIGCYAICYYTFRNYSGLGWIIARSITFITLFASGVILLKLTPDIFHVFNTVRRKIKRN